MKAFSNWTVAAVVALAAFSATAFAGSQTTQEVTFSAVKPYAFGDLGYVRNTADTVQYIGCEIGLGNAICYATNSAGVSHGCSTTDPVLMENVRAIHGDSHLIFAWNPDGTCKTVIVTSDSRYAPK